MTTQEIIARVEKLGATLIVLDGKLKATPPGVLPDDLKAVIREHASEIKAILPKFVEQTSATHADWAAAAVPDSRAPLVPPEIRAKIETVESDARAKGWPAELLWGSGFWDCPRGLAAVLEADDEIAEVTDAEIVILKTRHDLLRFRRRND